MKRIQKVLHKCPNRCKFLSNNNKIKDSIEMVFFIFRWVLLKDLVMLSTKQFNNEICIVFSFQNNFGDKDTVY